MIEEDKAVELCIEYINNKNCSYLAKEDSVVYYSSDTGRSCDYTWHTMTLSQAHKIIVSMYASEPFPISKLMQAFQELGKVYERGVNSRHKVKDELFNYFEHGSKDVNIIIQDLCSKLLNRGYYVVRFNQIISLINDVAVKLDLDKNDNTEKIVNYLEEFGYDVRTGSRRPRVGGHLVACAIYGSYKPKDLRFITKEDYSAIYKELIRNHSKRG